MKIGKTIKVKPHMHCKFNSILIKIIDEENRIIEIKDDRYVRTFDDLELFSIYFINEKERIKCLKELEEAIRKIAEPYNKKWFAKKNKRIKRKERFRIKKSRSKE